MPIVAKYSIHVVLYIEFPVPIPVKFHTYKTKGKIIFVNECLTPSFEMTNCK